MLRGFPSPAAPYLNRAANLFVPSHTPHSLIIRSTTTTQTQSPLLSTSFSRRIHSSSSQPRGLPSSSSSSSVCSACSSLSISPNLFKSTSLSPFLSPSSSPLLLSSPSRSFAKPSYDNKEGNSNRFAYTLDNVTKRFSTGRQLFKNVSLSFYDGAKIGILGVNGSGKSSLLKIIAGVDKEFEGSALPLPGLKIGYLAQEPELDGSKTVGENIEDGVKQKKELLMRYDEISTAFGAEDADIEKLGAEQAEVGAKIDELNCWDLQHKIDMAMEALNCPPSDSPVTTLSGGERRRVALCRLLLSEPHILLLDEPTNHLDAESVSWLEQFLAQYPGLVIAITHDRYFLDKVAGYILEIDAGHLYPFKGNYGSWLEQKSKRLAQEKKRNVALDKMMERELEWVRAGAKAQQTKSKARLKNFERLMEEKRQRLLNKRAEGGNLLIPEGPRLSENALAISHLSYQHPDINDGSYLFRDVSFKLGRGDIVGIIGPNGVGKTTLLKLLVGEKKLNESHGDKGEIRISPTVQFGYNSQTRDSLNNDNPVWLEIVGTAEFVAINPDVKILSRAYVAQFNFNGQDQQKRVEQLSGGERNRLALAKSMVKGCNVILLDEPTNDLDVDTLRSLEEALQEFDGAGVIISHDRWFLDRVCTHLLVFEPDGKAEFFEGNYTQYEADKRDRGESVKKQAKFKKITQS